MTPSVERTDLDFKFSVALSQIEIKAYFHFSHYKSMETLSFHSNENTWATAIKNKIYVEANVINIYEKFELYPPYGFWEEDFWIFISKI